jgi:hypothetical protein
MCVAIDPECEATVWASLLFTDGTLSSGLKRMDSAGRNGRFFCGTGGGRENNTLYFTNRKLTKTMAETIKQETASTLSNTNDAQRYNGWRRYWYRRKT